METTAYGDSETAAWSVDLDVLPPKQQRKPKVAASGPISLSGWPRGTAEATG